jgi:hypothetical protein
MVCVAPAVPSDVGTAHSWKLPAKQISGGDAPQVPVTEEPAVQVNDPLVRVTVHVTDFENGGSPLGVPAVLQLPESDPQAFEIGTVLVIVTALIVPSRPAAMLATVPL